MSVIFNFASTIALATSLMYFVKLSAPIKAVKNIYLWLKEEVIAKINQKCIFYLCP